MPKSGGRSWLIPLLLGITALGLHGIGADDLWYDEYRTFWYIGAAHYGDISLAETWTRVSENAVQTPGYYLLLNLWESIAGDTPFANRYPSLLFGLLTLAVIYRAGRELFTPQVGLAAAVLLGGSPFWGLFLHEMRTYTLVTLGVSAAIWLYWRLITGKHDPKTQLGFIAAVLSLPYTHYYAIMVGGAIALYHLLFVPKNRAWWRVPILMAVAVLLFVPWLGVLLRGANDIRTDDARVIFALSPHEIGVSVVDAFSGGSPLLFVLLAAAALGYGERAGRAVWFWTVGAFGLALIANAWSNSLSQTRYLLMILPLLALIGAMGIGRLSAWGVPLAVPLTVWLGAGAIMGANPTRYITTVHEPDWYFAWSTMQSLVAANENTADRLRIQLPHLTGAFAHQPLVEHYLHPLNTTGAVIEYPFFMTQSDYIASLDDHLNPTGRLWIARKPALLNPIDRVLMDRALSNAGYWHCATYHDTAELRLDLYGKPDQFAYQFGEGIRVGHIGMLPEPINDHLTVTLGWQITETTPANTYSYGVHVIDAAGTLVAQVDNGLPSAGETCTPLRIGLSRLPTGDYRADLLVYAWETGERLTGVHAEDSAERLLLTEFSR